MAGIGGGAVVGNLAHFNFGFVCKALAGPRVSRGNVLLKEGDARFGGNTIAILHRLRWRDILKDVWLAKISHCTV
jgi:hypothetical protein